MLSCGHEPSAHNEHTTGTGRVTRNGVQLDICWSCCADLALGQMLKHGKSFFYLHGGKITNWPGTTEFIPFSIRTGKHNIARTRTDVWFVGPDNYVWHGTQIGDFNEVCRVKRTKQIWKHDRA